MVEMVVRMVERVVLATFGVLLEVVMLMRLMVWGWTYKMVVRVTEGVL